MSLLSPKAIDEFQAIWRQKFGRGRPCEQADGIKCRYQVAEQTSPEDLETVFDLIFQKAVERWQGQADN